MREFLRTIFSCSPQRLASGELTQTGGEFTTQDLMEFGLGPKSRTGGRTLLYVDDVVPVRLVPVSLLNSVQKTWKETNQIEPIIESLWTSFWVYRECVNMHFRAPLVNKGENIWEWPEPCGIQLGRRKHKNAGDVTGSVWKTG